MNNPWMQISFFTFVSKDTEEVIFILRVIPQNAEFPREMLDVLRRIYEIKRVKKSEAETLELLTDTPMVGADDVGLIWLSDQTSDPNTSYGYIPHGA